VSPNAATHKGSWVFHFSVSVSVLAWLVCETYGQKQTRQKGGWRVVCPHEGKRDPTARAKEIWAILGGGKPRICGAIKVHTLSSDGKVSAFFRFADHPNNLP